jgi:hypothetical protein
MAKRPRMSIAFLESILFNINIKLKM